MKYIKKFDKHSDYEAYASSSGITSPNISLCELEYEVHYAKHDYSND